jgi:hypothetical protein
MFRAEIRWLADHAILKMEGRVVGDSAEQTKILVTNEVGSRAFVVDLSDVSYVDHVGEQVLRWLGSFGATFVAGNVYTEGLCQRMRLPVLRKREDVVAHDGLAQGYPVEPDQDYWERH